MKFSESPGIMALVYSTERIGGLQSRCSRLSLLMKHVVEKRIHILVSIECSGILISAAV
jgi:hypothetical protein